MTPADVTNDLAAAYARAQAELTRLSADLEALRAKAGAVWARGSGADHEALRAELDKPSGASLLAEIASLREQVKPGAIDRALAEAHANGEACDAWKALAKAREAWHSQTEHLLGGQRDDDMKGARGEVEKALAALRALGIDPEE